MGTGILICGLNGCGKSTLGEALAERMGYTWIDMEDCYFPKTDSRYPYAAPRSQKEAEQILRERICQSDHFVLTAVKGDFADDIIAAFEKVLWIRVPQAIRMRRVRNRSYEKFGSRMLPGGDYMSGGTLPDPCGNKKRRGCVCLGRYGILVRFRFSMEHRPLANCWNRSAAENV